MHLLQWMNQNWYIVIRSSPYIHSDILEWLPDLYLAMVSPLLLLVITLCLTLLQPRGFRPPGCSVHGISQARIPEWFAISCSRGSSRLRDWTHVSCVGKQIVYPWATREALLEYYKVIKRNEVLQACLVLLFTLLHFSDIVFFYILKICSNSALLDYGWHFLAIKYS